MKLTWTSHTSSPNGLLTLEASGRWVIDVTKLSGTALAALLTDLGATEVDQVDVADGSSEVGSGRRTMTADAFIALLEAKHDVERLCGYDLPPSGAALQDASEAMLSGEVHPRAQTPVCFRRFTHEDWMSYSGAERFKNSVDPMSPSARSWPLAGEMALVTSGARYRWDTTQAEVVVDSTGAAIYWTENETVMYCTATIECAFLLRHGMTMSELADIGFSAPEGLAG